VRRTVSFGDRPAVVDERMISLIKQRLAEVEGSGCAAYRFKPGDRVVIRSAPLRDFEASFEDKLSYLGRAKILVDFLGGWTPCEMEIDCLEKAR